MIRRGIAATAAIALTTSGIGLLSVAAVAADEARYLPASEITWTSTPEEETASYNVWHFDPSSTVAAEQKLNGLLVKAGERALIVEGTGNDVVENGGQPVDATSVTDLASSLDVVTSHPNLVHYQIPVFYGWGEEGIAPKFTTLRKQVSAEDDKWVSSAAIDADGDGTPEIAHNATYNITEIADALDEAGGDNVTPIAAGFIIDKVDTDVLVSSFTANGEQVKFYGAPVADSYTGEAQTLVHQQIRPDEAVYNGWHQGHEPARGEYVTVMENGVPAGLKLTRDVQILNGLGDDLALVNALELARTMEVEVAEGSSPVWSQIPIFAFQDGVLGDGQFTTLRAQIPASGKLADAEAWVSSRDIKDATGAIIIKSGEALSFDELLSKIDNHAVIGYGFLTSGANANATVRSVTFDGVTTSFYQEQAAWEADDVYVPLSAIVPTSNAAEETENYNVWHFDPSSTTDADQKRNGIVVPQGERALIVEGNGNDLVGPTGALADSTAIPALIESLEIVTSNDALVHYQIPLRFDYNEEMGSWNWATLRQRADADNDQWISSRAIGTDIKANTAYPIDEIVAALNSYGDARVIAAGFIIDKPSEDVLISSFSAKDVTTYFYEADEATGSYDGADEFVIDEQIRPDEEAYPGWHDGHPNPGTYETVYRGPQANGVQLEGTVQLINGFEPENFIQNGVELASTLEVDIASGDDPVFAQIPIFYYPDGSLNEKFTTIRTEFNESGIISEDAQWTTSQNIVDSNGDVVIAKNTSASLADIKAALGKHDVLAYGILTWESGPVVINSITFDGVTTSFVGNAVAVAPEAPTQSGDNGETITIPTVDGVEYLVGGEVQTGEITLNIGESVTVTARAADGYAFEDGAVTEWTLSYINTVVEAEAPTLEDNVVTIPTVEGVEYLLDGETVTGDITLLVGQTIEITARAIDGYELQGDADWSFTYVNTQITATAPAFEDNTITIPVVEGVEYLVDGEAVTGDITVPIDSTVTVTAQATAGYDLVGTTSWDFDYVDVIVTATAPTFENNAISIPVFDGVEYVVDGEVVTGSVAVEIGETVEVTARAIAGYELAGDSAASWSFAYVNVVVGAKAPALEDNTITIPVVEGVEYVVDGEVVSGTVEITKDTTVTARAIEGYVLAEDSVTEWDFKYVAPIVEVTAVAPAFEDNTITIPVVEGVEYLVDGKVVSGSVAVEISETVEVTARAIAGYELAEDSADSWSFTYVNDSVTAVAPTLLGKTVTIPNVKGVEYVINGKVVTGTYDLANGQTVTVTARAVPGYDLLGTSSWKFSYSAVAKGNIFYILNSWNKPTEDFRFAYGRQGDEVFVGDWDGDGYDTLAVRRGNTFFVNNELRGGNADSPFKYGRVNDQVLVGDWNGDGKDTFGIRRGNTFHLKNSLAGGNADASFNYGRTTDEVFIGDWDGDKKDTVTVRRGNTFHVSNSFTGGNAARSYTYGRVTDDAIAGDWNGDGKDTMSLRRGNTYIINNGLTGGNAGTSIRYGRANDNVIIGDWNGDGIDTIAVNRYVG